MELGLGPAWGSPESDLLQATAERIIDRELAEGLDALPRDEQAFFLVWIAEGMVQNGGMAAVCYNSTGDYLANIPWAMRAIGAPEKAALFERLKALFGPEGPSPDLEPRLQQFNALPDEVGSELDTLDDLFFNAPESMDDLLWRWCEPWARARLGT